MAAAPAVATATVYHVRGRDSGRRLAEAQDRLYRTLRDAAAKTPALQIVSCEDYTKAQFTALIRIAPANSIVLYDGYGSKDGQLMLHSELGCFGMVREAGLCLGSEIASAIDSRTEGPVVVLLHCSYAVSIATAARAKTADVSRTDVRATIASLLGAGDGDPTSEIDWVMAIIDNESIYLRTTDHPSIAARMAKHLDRVGAPGRLAELYGWVYPLAIGQYPTKSDPTYLTDMATVVGHLARILSAPSIGTRRSTTENRASAVYESPQKSAP